MIIDNNKALLLISRNQVLFPGSFCKIDIERQASISVINLALEKYNGHIIFICQKSKEIDSPNINDIYKIGTYSHIEAVKKNSDNSLIVRVRGIKRVAITAIDYFNLPHYDHNLYQPYISEFEILKETNTTSPKTKKLLLNLFNKAEFGFQINKKYINSLKDKYEKCILNSSSFSKIVDELCNEIAVINQKVSVIRKQGLLEALDIEERLSLLLEIDFLSSAQMQSIDSSIQKKVDYNINKQQSDFYLREKIKVIKEKLGDSYNRESEIEKIKKWLKDTKAPKKIKNKVFEEMNKLEIYSFSSGELAVVKNYIDYLLSLPWSKYSKDEKDIEKIKNSLDKDHFGLEKIKDRIMEFIAVQKRKKSPAGTVICFVGPPGVGKTSLAQSIAKALNKKYVKISLGGISDESEIRGHKKTYIGAMPGKIVKALKTSKYNNPLILLDEIDKMTNSFQGDPASALLEALDPKQNNHFLDNYLEEEIDLSKIMFIATANYEENIPEALIDRLEILNLTSYTENEKLSIATNHLINEVLEEHNISPEELKFEISAITHMIRKYTREAGVRGLKRQISQIARKFAKKQELKLLDSEIITIEKLKEYLLHEVYNFTVKDEIAIPGIVNGMAYTEFGGDLLPIEVNYYNGKGNLLLTGNLKDTMKESANVALSYIRANEEEFKIKNINWADIDINLHVPAGGIPKDGPSAGITITTALISSFLNVSVPCNIAMTGEITLRGKVLPIGGLREKIISAARGGVEIIFYPKECEKYLEEIPEEILEKIKLHPIKHYKEIYQKIFA